MPRDCKQAERFDGRGGRVVQRWRELGRGSRGPLSLRRAAQALRCPGHFELAGKAERHRDPADVPREPICLPLVGRCTSGLDGLATATRRSAEVSAGTPSERMEQDRLYSFV